MGWDAPTLANYMRKLELNGCDKVVMKYVINGSKFLNMQNNELQKFPNAPLINKLRYEINKNDLNQGYFTNKSSSPRYQVQGVQECEVSDDSDHDYESPASDNDRPLEEDYVCPIGDRSDALMDCGDVQQRHSQVQAVRSPALPGSGPSRHPYNCNSLVGSSPSRQSQSTCTPFKPPAAMAPKVDRSIKPVWLMTGQSEAAQAPFCQSLSGTKFDGTDGDLDSSWYIGPVTRAYAESCLRMVNMDGAFLVRNSSKCSSVQPYTLMVLYQDKVYNIQVRYNGDHETFSLGTGLNSNENFRTVGAIIQHHMQIPLLLIEANYNGPRRHCPLLYPAVLQY
ncbi:lymphocyte cytosolic protein 2-like isoform X1 [Arapaima gigas]